MQPLNLTEWKMEIDWAESGLYNGSKLVEVHKLVRLIFELLIG